MKLGLITLATCFAVGCFDGAALTYAKDYEPPMASAHTPRGAMPRIRHAGIEVGPFNVGAPSPKRAPVKLAATGAVKAKLAAPHFGVLHDCYTRPLEAGGPGDVTVCEVD